MAKPFESWEQLETLWVVHQGMRAWEKIPLEAQVSSGHTGKKGLLSQHHNPQPGKAIKRRRDDI